MFPPRCSAAVLTFLDELAPRLTERGSAGAPWRRPPPLRQHKAPSLTSDTKWRPRRSHMTPLYSQTRRMHKYAGKKHPICPHAGASRPAWAQTCTPVRVRRSDGPNSSCFYRENRRPFCESLRRKKKKKRGTPPTV